jgi:hypothetical protein
MAVGARHDEAVEAAALEFGAQRSKTAGARRAFAGIIERLQARLEHRGNLWGASRSGNRPLRRAAMKLHHPPPLCAAQQDCAIHALNHHAF